MAIISQTSEVAMSFETRRIRPKENVEIDLSECGTCKCPEKKTMRVPERHLMCCIWVWRLTHRYAVICDKSEITSVLDEVPWFHPVFCRTRLWEVSRRFESTWLSMQNSGNQPATGKSFDVSPKYTAVQIEECGNAWTLNLENNPNVFSRYLSGFRNALRRARTVREKIWGATCSVCRFDLTQVKDEGFGSANLMLWGGGHSWCRWHTAPCLSMLPWLLQTCAILCVLNGHEQTSPSVHILPRTSHW